MGKKIKFEHFIPLLAAIFPVLSLTLENVELIKFDSIIRSLLISVLAAYIFYIVLYIFVRKWDSAAVLSGLLILILSNYGKTYLFIETQMGEAIQHRYLVGIFAALFILVGALVVFKIKNLRDLSLGIFSGILVIVVYLLGSIGLHEINTYKSDEQTENSRKLIEQGIMEDDSENLPDIYVVILDAHTRSDVMKNAYKYDNSGFISQLESMGFWVADCAQSNYPGTNLSVTSLYEMDYIHNIYEEFENLIFPPLNRTAVFSILNEKDYTTVTFDNYFFDHFDITDDIMFSKEDGVFGSINEFEQMMVDTSVLRLLLDMEGFFPESWTRPFKDDVFLTHYQDIHFALDKLPRVSDIGERLFVIAHLMVTHDPFVIMPDGSFGSSNQGKDIDYRNAVEFIDTTLPDILEEIISSSEEPPIILLMGDHGASIKGNPIEERMSILFALYLQGEAPEVFYDGLTPVNAFRIVFNYLFDADYELIEDKSYPIWNKSNSGKIDTEVVAPCTP